MRVRQLLRCVGGHSVLFVRHGNSMLWLGVDDGRRIWLVNASSATDPFPQSPPVHFMESTRDPTKGGDYPPLPL